MSSIPKTERSQLQYSYNSYCVQIRAHVKICMYSYSIVVHGAHCVLVVISQINHKTLLRYHSLAIRLDLSCFLWEPLGKVNKFDANKEEWAQYNTIFSNK